MPFDLPVLHFKRVDTSRRQLPYKTCGFFLWVLKCRVRTTYTATEMWASLLWAYLKRLGQQT